MLLLKLRSPRGCDPDGRLAHEGYGNGDIATLEAQLSGEPSWLGLFGGEAGLTQHSLVWQQLVSTAPRQNFIVRSLTTFIALASLMFAAGAQLPGTGCFEAVTRRGAASGSNTFPHTPRGRWLRPAPVRVALPLLTSWRSTSAFSIWRGKEPKSGEGVEGCQRCLAGSPLHTTRGHSSCAAGT